MIFGLFLFNINALFTGDRKVEESVNVFALSYQSRSSYIWKHYKLINQICSNTETLTKAGFSLLTWCLADEVTEISLDVLQFSTAFNLTSRILSWLNL